MKISLSNLKIEKNKYKAMLYTCSSDENLKAFIEKEIKRIDFEMNAIIERNKVRKKSPNKS